MKHKLLLVVPDYFDEEIDKYTKSNTIPYGVLSLASYVEYYCPEITCEIIDFNLIRNKKAQYEVLEKKLKEFKPNFIGISAMFNTCFEQINPICETAKKINPEIIIFAGGVLATNLADDIFNISDLIDALSYGEGEIPLRDLFLGNNPKETFKTHQSWVTKEDFKNGKKGIATFVQNLDEIPPIDFSKIDITKYTSRTPDGSVNEGIQLPIHSSRGCPFNCIFCCAHANHGKKIRCMSVGKFLSDVKIMVDKYNTRKLSIDDDQFLFYTDRAKKILRGLIELNIEIELASGVSLRYIDDELAVLLKEAGLKTAFIAVESGSQRMLKEIIDKPLEVSQIKPAVDALRKAGLFVHAPFLFGIPGETEEDRGLTRQLILDTGFDWCYIFVATPFKGSRLYDICVENNYIDPKTSCALNVYRCGITAPGINPEEITEFAYTFNLDVNFVNNYNYRSGNYELALQYFARLAGKYPDHAFAHYYASLSYEKLRNKEKAKMHMQEYDKIINTNKNWAQYAINFGLEKAKTIERF